MFGLYTSCVMTPLRNHVGYIHLQQYRKLGTKYRRELSPFGLHLGLYICVSACSNY